MSPWLVYTVLGIKPWFLWLVGQRSKKLHLQPVRYILNDKLEGELYKSHFFIMKVDLVKLENTM